MNCLSRFSHIFTSLSEIKRFANSPKAAADEWRRTVTNSTELFLVQSTSNFRFVFSTHARQEALGISTSGQKVT